MVKNMYLLQKIKTDKYMKLLSKYIEPSYDVHTFNLCAERGCVLLSLECWDKVHPDIKSIQLEETYTLPFGIVYANDAGNRMADFITSIRLAINAN